MSSKRVRYHAGLENNCYSQTYKHIMIYTINTKRTPSYLSISLASSATAQPSRCTSSMHKATARSPSLSSPSPSPSTCCCAAVVKRDRNRRSATVLSGALRATTRIILTGGKGEGGTAEEASRTRVHGFWRAACDKRGFYGCFLRR